MDQFYLQRKVKAMGCLINKVASTSVVRSFVDVDSRNLTYDPLYLRSPHAFKVDLVPTVSELTSTEANEYIRTTGVICSETWFGF